LRYGVCSLSAVSSTPTFQKYNPRLVPWQYRFVDHVFEKADYSLGVHQFLLSGTIASGKSLPVAHVAIRHCLQWPNACFLIGRQKLPDLKKTLYKKIKQHGADIIQYYDFRDTEAYIKFKNGSEILGYSWFDADYESFGSLELSGLAIEEASENTGKHVEAYKRLLTRVGRLPHVGQQLAIVLTNPDEPGHWIYEHFGLAGDEGLEDPPVTRPTDQLKHVYYSSVDDNPFIPKTYKENLAKDMDPITADRLLRGLWVPRTGSRPYYGYEKARNFSNTEYKINPNWPVRLSWDFNIAEGKPLSSVAFQYDVANDHFHFFDEVVVEGFRTEDSCDEWNDRGYFSKGYAIRVHGDATGASKSTRSNFSDYDIIMSYIRKRTNNVERRVTKANPEIRKRQNLVNRYCLNDLDQSRLTVYAACKTVDKGLRLTKLKKGSNYQEDDSDPFQHIVTAVGYGIHQSIVELKRIQRTHYA